MDDDIYEGFDGLEAKISFDEPPMTNATRLSITSNLTNPARSTGRMPTGQFRLMSGMSVNTPNRPMTSVRAAGFTSAKKRRSTGLNTGGVISLLQLDENASSETTIEDSPEVRVKKMEKNVKALIEQSCLADANNDLVTALEKAKEAGRQERVLIRQREQLGLADQIDLDLSYSVLFNLANRYAANGMYQEAINVFNSIVRNKMFAQAGRLKVNMGNVYFAQKNYPKAIKLYRMGLDQVPTSHKSMRVKIMRNIGIAFVKLGQLAEASTAFEHIMQEEPDARTGFNLLLCYYLTDDAVKMKATFQKLLHINLLSDDEDRYLPHNDDKQYELILEVIRNDELSRFEREKKGQLKRLVKTGAKLIAPVIEANFELGYDWCIEQVKASPSNADTANDLELDKAVMHLKQRDFQPTDGGSIHSKAIESLKSFEKKDSRVAYTAAIILSFIYFTEGDLNQADRYAELALSADRYNPAALVSKGNVCYQQDHLDRARDFYLEALQNDSSCIEALFNLGLVCKQLERFEEALDTFLKLHTMLRDNASVIFHIMEIYERLEEPSQVQEWVMQLHGLVPTDPFLLQRMGDNCEQEGDKSQAFSYYYDSFRYYPCNFDVIEWLGAYYIESQFCEKAISYFERASLMQPNETKWFLMIASCHRRSGNYQQALETYKVMHKRFPENIDCLRFLVRICSDMDLPEAHEFLCKLKKAEKVKEARDQRQIGRKIFPGGRLSDTSSTSRVSSGGDSRASLPQMPPPTRASNRSSLTSSHQSTNNRRDMPPEPLPLGNNPVSYCDPLGPSAQRPMTSSRSRTSQPMADDFSDDIVDDTMLPD